MIEEKLEILCVIDFEKEDLNDKFIRLPCNCNYH
jgi:hypothetical protein